MAGPAPLPAQADGRPWLSVVLPFWHKLAEFERVLPLNAPHWARPGVEVVLVLDAPEDEAAVLRRLSAWPAVRWRVLVNDQAHAWRPPCVAINAGVRHAAGDYLLIHSPESAYLDDAPALVLPVLRQHPTGVVIGRVGFARFDALGAGGRADLAAVFAQCVPQALELRTFYGSLACSRARFEAVGGYDEGLDGWGGDDDNLRVRLEMAGARLLACPDLRLLHLAFEPRTGGERFDRGTDHQRCTPAQAVANEGRWGRGVTRVALDGAARAPEAGNGAVPGWLDAAEHVPVIPVGSRRQCGWCGRMLHHEPPAVFCPRCGAPPAAAPGPSAGRLPILCVMQLHNEAHHLPGCLAHLREHVDGFVLLDDGSTDGTADIAARAPGLRALLRNPPRQPHVWDERDNQRRLLREAARLGAGWVLVCDADQRYETLFLRHLRSIADALPAEGPAGLSVQVCELWDGPDRFRTDGPWGSKAHTALLRLPREIDFTQGPPLHGGWLPDAMRGQDAMRRAWYRVYHLRMVHRADRLARRDRYLHLDPQARWQPGGYDYLAEEGPSLRLQRIETGRGYADPAPPPG